MDSPMRDYLRNLQQASAPPSEAFRPENLGFSPPFGSNAPLSGGSTPSLSVTEKLGKAIAAADKSASEGTLRVQDCIQFFTRVKSALSPVFGEKSEIIAKLSLWTKEFAKLKEFRGLFLTRLQEVNHFAGILESASSKASFVPESRQSLYPKTNRVFIIHGHDEINWLRLKDTLQSQFGLEAVVILARPGQSQPTIDKFEKEAAKCAYAFAFFTPDDLTQNDQAGTHRQARPNVIFEAGWFIGRLGRDRVLLLVKNGTKLHSDFDGINRVQFDDDITHHFLQIQQELEAAGMAGPNKCW